MEEGFSPDLWNVHDTTMHNVPRTNNFEEGWNFKYNSNINHPTVWKSMETIQSEQEATATKIFQGSIGQPPRKRRSYKQLRQLCVDYTNEVKARTLSTNIN